MYISPKALERAPLTILDLHKMKQDGMPIVALTAYDASFAAVMDEVGVDIVLVGDSLGMVVQGHDSTLPVSVDEIIYHTRCVRNGLHSALLIADMPFAADATPEQAMQASAGFLAEGGASMVKLEGAGHKLETIRFLVDREVPVCAHLGLTPQSVLRLGGYRVQGRDTDAAKQLLLDAHRVVDAGASLLVLECVPESLAQEITKVIAIPTIGIGAGAQTDGQILVMHDLLGVTRGKRPKFVRNFLAESGSVEQAIANYAHAVRTREFPGTEHSFS